MVSIGQSQKRKSSQKSKFSESGEGWNFLILQNRVKFITFLSIGEYAICLIDLRGIHRRIPGAEFGGTGTDQDFWMMFFRKKNQFHAQNTFFSHRPCFSHFPYLFSDFPHLYCMKCRMWPFLHKKNTYFRKEFLDDTFFTLFVLSRASNDTISQNIGGTDAWAVPTSNLFGWNAPQSPIGLRPWGLPGVNAPEGTCLKRIENSIEN